MDDSSSELVLSNLVDGLLGELARHGDGCLRLPVGEARVSFIDARDIAEVALTAVERCTDRAAFDLTGPESLTFAQLVAQTAHVVEAPRRFEPTTAGEFRRQLVELGSHPRYVEVVDELMSFIAAGHASAVTFDVPGVLGRPAISVAEFAGSTRNPDR